MIDIQANFLAVCKGLLPEVWGYAYFWYIFILKCPEVYLQNEQMLSNSNNSK